MITTTDNSIRVLNDLIAINRDSEHGFKTCAANVGDHELSRTLDDYASQRSKCVTQLQDRVRILRSEPANSGTVAGAVHRGWLGLKAAIAANELHSILEECERGEDVATGAYREALQERDLDIQTRELIQRQYELVQAAHDRVKQLRDSETYAHR